MSAGFTPGPWSVATDDAECVVIGGYGTLAEAPMKSFIDCNCAADARLIAAAPDLYGALLPFRHTHGERGDAVRAALAKARGDQ